jgi:hypothetical protein
MNEKEKENYEHEAFGRVQFNRINGRAHFYGSDLPQDTYIELEISNSEIQRDLMQDRYYPTKQLIKARMSSGQFSELITSMNSGSGACCTVERFDGKKIENLPEIENRKEFVNRKFEDRMKFFADSIKKTQQEAKELVKKKTLSKEDVRSLSNKLEWLTTEISNNIPFFAKCFQETMDEMVFEAKLEVDNAIQHKINVLGLNALHEQNKILNANNE